VFIDIISSLKSPRCFLSLTPPLPFPLPPSLPSGALEVIIAQCSNYIGLKGENIPMSPNATDRIQHHVCRLVGWFVLSFFLCLSDSVVMRIHMAFFFSSPPAYPILLPHFPFFNYIYYLLVSPLMLHFLLPHNTTSLLNSTAMSPSHWYCYPQVVLSYILMLFIVYPHVLLSYILMLCYRISSCCVIVYRPYNAQASGMGRDGLRVIAMACGSVKGELTLCGE
jgi:hypothetical protein